MEESILLQLSRDELRELIKEAVRDELAIVKSAASTEMIMGSDDAAHYLGISKSTLYKFTSDNVVPYYKPTGKRIYFKKSELEEWMLNNRSMSRDEIEQKANEYILKNRRY